MAIFIKAISANDIINGLSTVSIGGNGYQTKDLEGSNRQHIDSSGNFYIAVLDGRYKVGASGSSGWGQ